PAIIRTRHLELHHRYRIRRATHYTQPATDTLLLINNHVRAAFPHLRPPVHRITLHHTRKALHTDAVIRTDIHTARTENTDRRVDHNIQLALQTAPRLAHCLLRRIA